MFTIKINSLTDLQNCIPEVLAALDGRIKIALYGEMGAGKTTFTKAFCAHLNVRETTASPTFSLINDYSYRKPDGEKGLVHHLDLYRLKSIQEALDIGIEDVLYDDNYCIIEWPQLVETLLPEETAKITVEIVSKNRRNVLIL